MNATAVNGISNSASSSSASLYNTENSADRPPKERQLSGGAKRRFLVSRVVGPEQQQVDPLVEQKPLVEVEQRAEGHEEGEEEEEVAFRYTWPVRITQRLIGAGESAILKVSPPFCTAYNGVQFTWLLRICEEEILDFGDSADSASFPSQFASSPHADEWRGKKVNITLYYKEGPARDVRLRGGNICIRNSEGLLFDSMPLRELEYTKGGGWSPLCGEMSAHLSEEQRKFSEFIHDHVGRQITVRVQLKMPASLFEPLQYLPSIDSPISGKLEALCGQVLDEIRLNQLQVPDVQYFDPKTDKYALYRHVFQFACEEIHDRVAKTNGMSGVPGLMEKIGNIFAHYYFNTVIVREAECFEDFLEALDASRHVQFPALRRECERYICAEVMTEWADLTLVKKMLLLAERFNLPVLKMVSFGVIMDRLLLQQHDLRPPARHNPSQDSGAPIGSMEEIREELLEIAEQIMHPDLSSSQQSNIHSPNNFVQRPMRKHSKSLCSTGHSSDSSTGEEGDDEEEEGDSDPGGETLVGSVINQLEELARHIRKVSMPPGVSPAPTPSGRPISPEMAQNSPGIISTDSGACSADSRRSSLKTTREFLQQHPRRSGSGCAGGSGRSGSFFTQIYHPSSVQSASSTESVPRMKTRTESAPDAVLSCSPRATKNVQFVSFADNTSSSRAKRAQGSRLGSSSSSKLLYRSQFEVVSRHREADEDEGVDDLE